MLPIPNILDLLWLLTSIPLSVFNVGAEVGPNPPPWVAPQYHDTCGIYNAHVSLIWVDSDKPDSECFSLRTGHAVPKHNILAHEIGHGIEHRCTSEADRAYFKVVILGLHHSVPWHDDSNPFSPSEQFADAAGQALTDFRHYHTLQGFRAENSAISFFARCAYQYEFYSVHYAYSVFNEVYAPQMTKDFWVHSILDGDLTAFEFVDNHVWTTNRVRDMHAFTFVEHMFLNVLQRGTIPGAERQAWRNYALSHTQEETFDLLMRVIYG